MTPRVSIGLPVYNGERYLAVTLRDILGQTFGDFELVVCDNASTDGTADILADAARQDDRLRVIRNESNLGALANANKAFDESRAPLYVLTAYDDRHAPEYLARLVSALDENPRAGFAYGRATLIDDDGVPLRFDPERELYLDAHGQEFDYDARLHRPMPADPIGRYRAVLRSNDINAPIYGVFRREVLVRVGPHRLHGSDRLIVAHAALLSPAVYVDAPLFGYRIHTESTYHLTRSEWLQREAGKSDASSPLDSVHTLRAYLAAVASTPLSARQRAAALYETLRYAVRPQVLSRLFRPGPDHYFGWTGSGQAPERREEGPGDAALRASEEWAWLSTGSTDARE